MMHEQSTLSNRGSVAAGCYIFVTSRNNSPCTFRVYSGILRPTNEYTTGGGFMAEITQLSIEIDTSIKEVMQQVKEEEGIPLAVQIRFAVLEYLEGKGRSVPPEFRRKVS